MAAEVWMVYETNSPELQADCGAFNLIGIYDSEQKAAEGFKKYIDGDKDFGFIPVEIRDDYAISYKDGDENSILYSEYHIEKTVLQ